MDRMPILRGKEVIDLEKLKKLDEERKPGEGKQWS